MSIARRWVWELDAPREQMWRYVADSDWVNEHAGLPRIEALYEPAAGGGTRRFASFRQGPFTVRWEERPTIWQVPDFYSVERTYSHGPLRRFFNRTALEALSAQRTRLVVDVELEAASALLEPLLPLLAAHGKRGADRAFALAGRLAARDAVEQSNGAIAATTARTSVPLGRFEPILQAGVDPGVAQAIAGFVDAAEDRDVVRMRPYELADRCGLARRDVLRGFLAATRAGLFNLSWSVICPGCRGPTPPIAALDDLQRGYHCPACNLPFDSIFDRSVEVTFDARPLGRGADQGLFCIASPQRSSHVFAQCAPPPGTTETLELTLAAGSYDVNAVGVGLSPFVAGSEQSSHEFRAEIASDATLSAPDAIASGRIVFHVGNELDRQAVVRIENGRWPDTIATAAQVTALQEFRDLFSSQVLSPGLELGIETIAVLFTDLVGSTAMYSRSGDAPAFRVVTDHFDVLREIVARCEGAVVKTIGDAVMAVFVDPSKCLDAALELDRCVRRIEHDGMPLQLRVGFHAGPCIAMRANERIDYFGTTVNLAARLQGLAHGGEVTMARSVAGRPDIAQRLQSVQADVSSESAHIKGFAQPVEIVRVSNVR